jgi:hypothetical protein
MQGVFLSKVLYFDDFSDIGVIVDVWVKNIFFQKIDKKYVKNKLLFSRKNRFWLTCLSFLFTARLQLVSRTYSSFISLPEVLLWSSSE